MQEGIPYSVIVDACRDIVGRSLYRLIGIAHGNTDACRMEYAHIVAAVAERNTLFRTDADMLRQLQQCIALVGSPQGYVCKSRIPAG